MATVTIPLTVSTSPAYTAGDAVGAKFSLAELGNSGAITKVVLRDVAGQTSATYELWVFRSNPSAATITDNTAFAISTDIDKVTAIVPIAAPRSGGTGGAVAVEASIWYPIRAETGTGMYGCIVTRGAPTYAAITDVAVTIQTEPVP